MGIPMGDVPGHDRLPGGRMVSKILKDLKVGGYIEIEQKRIVLLKTLPDRW